MYVGISQSSAAISHSIGMNVPEMRAVVRSPSGLSEPAEIVQVGANEYSISFVPHELGSHLVDVLHRGRHIPGSPFQFTVGPITEGQLIHHYTYLLLLKIEVNYLKSKLYLRMPFASES